MSVLVGIHSISKSFGTQHLFENISFTICQGERIGLIGPNGSGKTTLLRILVGIEKADEGHISKKQGLRIGYASQLPEFPSLSLEEVLTKEIPHGDEIEVLTKARILLGKMQFNDFLQRADLLSGGWKKRLDIARALMHDPDLLLLDEPTNHLDLEGIEWLEKFLSRERLTYLVISHDRYFLENVSNKIIEINKCYPQGIFSCEGPMSAYIEKCELFLEAQKKQEQGLASTVRDEIEWLRKSPKARTTKSQARIKQAYHLIEELKQIKTRNKVTAVDIQFSASDRETRKLIVAKNLCKSLGGKQLFKGVDLVLSPGSRLGIVGKNGTGKTTLLKMLARQIPQDMGTLKYADDLKLVYFDQHREHINPEASLRRALSPTSDLVNYRGQSIHVNGWAKKFLFSPDRMELPVKCLSGGERARILIARLMLEDADVLFLDEPTNDLDIPTLEVIEESLMEFNGAVVLISHDRCLMDRICNQVIGLGSENEQQLFADYNQWEEASKKQKPKVETKTEKEVVRPAVAQPKKKLSYKEQKELEGMEASIAKGELEVAELQKQLEGSHDNAQKALELYRQLGAAQARLDGLFDRWQELLDKGT